MCLLDPDNEKFEAHFNVTLTGNNGVKDGEQIIAEEVSIKQLIDLHSFIECILKMRENK